MPRNTIIALVLIVLVVLVLLFNKGTVDVNLLATQVKMMRSLAFLLFTGLGVLIGMLLK